MKYAKLLTFIENIGREEFYQNFVSRIGSTKLFSHFATDPEHTSDEDKSQLRGKLTSAGVPAKLIASDEDLYAATKFIIARAIKIR